MSGTTTAAAGGVHIQFMLGGLVEINITAAFSNFNIQFTLH